MHGGELLGEDGLDCVFVVFVIGKIKKNGVGASVGVLAEWTPVRY